jgi:hypothetical protein
MFEAALSQSLMFASAAAAWSLNTYAICPI